MIGSDAAVSASRSGYGRPATTARAQAVEAQHGCSSATAASGSASLSAVTLVNGAPQGIWYACGELCHQSLRRDSQARSNPRELGVRLLVGSSKEVWTVL